MYRSRWTDLYPHHDHLPHFPPSHAVQKCLRLFEFRILQTPARHIDADTPLFARPCFLPHPSACPPAESLSVASTNVGTRTMFAHGLVQTSSMRRSMPDDVADRYDVHVAWRAWPVSPSPPRMLCEGPSPCSVHLSASIHVCTGRFPALLRSAIIHDPREQDVHVCDFSLPRSALSGSVPSRRRECSPRAALSISQERLLPVSRLGVLLQEEVPRKQSVGNDILGRLEMRSPIDVLVIDPQRLSPPKGSRVILVAGRVS